MNLYTVAFAPEAEEQLAALYHYIAAAASPVIAERYTSAIITHCEEMHAVPNRGTRRDDVRLGLRITNYKRRTVIAFAVDDANLKVTIIGIYYGGQNYEVALQTDEDE